MNCMKCGKETVSSNVFCEACLEDMRHHPVKSGTAVVIPNRPESKRAISRRKSLSYEEQISRMQVLIRWLLVAVILLSISFGISVAALAHNARQQEAQDNLGKNYSTVAPTAYPNRR